MKHVGRRSPSLDVPRDVPLTASFHACTLAHHQDDRRDGYDNRGAPPGPNPNAPPGGPPDRRYDHSYNDGGYRGPNDRAPPPGRGGNWGTGRGGHPGRGFDPNAGNPAVMNRPSLMHGRGGYPNAGRPSMMHGPGAGHNKNRPSLHPRDRDRDRGYDEGEIGEITEPQPRDGSASREPWDDRRAERWGRGAERRHSGAFGAEEDGEPPRRRGARPRLPAGRPPPDAAYAAHAVSRDILRASAAPTPTMEPFAGTGPGAQPGAQLAGISRRRRRRTPAAARSPAPKRKKLGWGQGLARSKSTGATPPFPPMEQEKWNRSTGLPPCPSPKTRSLRRRTRFC